jgi:adenylylsulfate kinase
MKDQLHVIPHQHQLSKKNRNLQNQHNSFVVWFTGLSGSGKSTLANLLEQHLFALGIQTYILDGDNIRTGLNKDLDFSEEGRIENIRRIAEVAKLFTDAGVVVLTAFISPFTKDRELAKTLIGSENFLEVYVDCPLEVCETRDVKGLYQKARAGSIKNFTGIDSPFDIPSKPDVAISTNLNSLEDCLAKLIQFVQPKLSAIL